MTITLERGCAFPFAITFGIYGWFFHTRLVSSEVEAEFPAMCEVGRRRRHHFRRRTSEAEMAPVDEAIEACIHRFPKGQRTALDG